MKLPKIIVESSKVVNTVTIVSVVLLSLICSQAFSVELPETVIVAYCFPEAAGQSSPTNTFASANVIEFPYPWNSSLLTYWRGQGKIVIKRETFDPTKDYNDADWAAFEANLARDIDSYDGVAIEETSASLMNDNDIQGFLDAISNFKENHSEKLLFIYDMPSWNSNVQAHKTLLSGITTYADLFLEETYCTETYSIDCNWSYPWINDKLNALKLCGTSGTLGKTVIMLGAYFATRDRDDIGLAEHVKAQMDYVKAIQDSNKPRRGISLYAACYTTPAELTAIDQATATTMLELRFDEVSGTTANDASGMSNNGTLNNFSGNYWEPGKYGNALHFDGVDDCVSCGTGSSKELKEFTYTAWIKPDVINRQYQQIIGKNGIWQKGFYVSYGDLCGFVDQSSYAYTKKSSIITANTWQHVAMTYEHNEIKLYLNGQLLNAETKTIGDGTVNSTSSFALLLSNTAGGTTYPFDGLMDDVRVYSRALSATEVGDVYNNPDLQLRLRLDEQSGTTAKDVSGLKNNGTLNGFTAPYSSCWQAGMSGKALCFDGNNDYVSCGTGSSLELKEFTYTAWINPCSVSRPYQQIIGKDGIWQKGFYVSYGDLCGFVDQSTTTDAYTKKSSIITANTWQHVAMTYEQNEIKLYLNGQLLNAETKTIGDGTVNSTSSFALLLSNTAGGTTYPFYGLMDDVRVYSRALSQVEINGIYQSSTFPMLRFRFNEASGTTADDTSGKGNDGTLTGFTAPYTSCWQAGKSGKALCFDGINDYVSCGTSSSLELKEFTYTAWIYPYSVSRSYQQIIGKDGKWNKGFYISYGNLCGYVAQSSSGAYAYRTSIITANNWHHVAMTYSNNQVKLYLNGELLVTGTPGVGAVTSTSGNPLLISNMADKDPFNGLVDDVRVYSRALTAAEINDIKTYSNLD